MQYRYSRDAVFISKMTDQLIQVEKKIGEYST